MPTVYNLNEEKIIQDLSELVDEIKSHKKQEELKLLRKYIKKTVPLGVRKHLSPYLLLKTGSLKKSIQYINLFISMGKNRNLFPRDLIKLITSETKIPPGLIGNIKIHENFSFVEVPKDSAKSIIEQLNGKLYRGRTLGINYANDNEKEKIK